MDNLGTVPDEPCCGVGGGACFVEDTLVSTPDGQIPIQTLKVGDKIYAFNEHNDDTVIDTISNLMSHTPEEDTFGLYKITTKTNEVTATGNHPFVKLNPEYDDSGADWTSARLLKVGDKIYDESGIAQPIVSIEKLDHKEPTYNLSIEDTHTYIANGFRVHNAYRRTPQQWGVRGRRPGKGRMGKRPGSELKWEMGGRVGGRANTNNRGRFSGRTQSNPKGKSKKK
tara:strand:- start:45 stop:722 length:678 start_codon:yes stop_codon:yes gene_type:complete